MSQTPKELERIGEEASEENERFELEDTAIENTASELKGSGQIALQSALNMDACKLHATASIFNAPPRDTINWPLPDRPLPVSPPEVWKGGNTLAARSSSPSISLNKPLAGMGDSLNWKLSVLHRINAIKYTL